jgi:hypothetical protein
MAKHLQKSFRDQQVKALLKKYIDREVDLAHILGILNIRCSRFFQLPREYRDNSSRFNIAYQRRTWPWKIAPEVPLRTYNCSYILDRLRDEYRQKVSVPTIVTRAKGHDFYLS